MYRTLNEAIEEARKVINKFNYQVPAMVSMSKKHKTYHFNFHQGLTIGETVDYGFGDIRIVEAIVTK